MRWLPMIALAMLCELLVLMARWTYWLFVVLDSIVDEMQRSSNARLAESSRLKSEKHWGASQERRR